MQKNAGVSSLAYCAVSLSLAISCAGQAPPSGGPPDTTPPTIIATYPEPRTTKFNDRTVVIEFSKYVDRRSVEESIFISPDVGPLEFDWSGREVEIRFESADLRDNTTYVVTVGTDVVDVRNNNRMAESFSLAFSTGSALDSASLSGRVFDAKPDGITIFAYMLSHKRADTLRPSATKPDYVTQTGKEGTFTLDYLAWGTYRLFAVSDQYKNILYDPQVDNIGMASRDFTVNPATPAIDGIQFQVTMQDTTPPFVLDARAIHKNSVEVRFSESLDHTSILPKVFPVADTLSDSRVSVRDVFFIPVPLNVVYLITGNMDSTRTYRLTVNDVRDTAGNRLNLTANSAVFEGSSLSDTLAPGILALGLQDSVRNVAYDVIIDITLNEGIKRGPLEKSFQLADSTGKQVRGKFTWWSSAFVRFIPDEKLLPLAWYNVRVRLDSVQDFAGNRLRDSILIRRFQTVDWRKLGSMRGKVEDRANGDASPIYISAKSISDKKSVPMMKRLGAASEFVFDNVVEGQYVLHAFRDKDGNGKYTYGGPVPFFPSERFTVYPDTVKVRARWPVEGIVLRFEEN